MKKAVLVMAFLFLTTPVAAQEASIEPKPVDATEEIVATENVPNPGSFGDFFQRMNERLQLLTTRDQQRKAKLEEDFLKRSEAQLARCGEVGDSVRKEKCVQKMTERGDELMERLKKRADKVSGKREQLLQKIEKARNRRKEKLEQLNIRKEKVEERVEQRKENREERIENRKERMETKQEKLQTEDADKSVDDGLVQGVSASRPSLVDWIEVTLDDMFGR